MTIIILTIKAITIFLKPIDNLSEASTKINENDNHNKLVEYRIVLSYDIQNNKNDRGWGPRHLN